MSELSPRLKALALTGFERWKLLTHAYRMPDGRLRKLMTWPKPKAVSQGLRAPNIEYMRAFRARNIAAGLRADGKPRKRAIAA